MRFRTDARNVTVEMQYDALDRVTDIIYPDSSLNVTFDYDGTTGNTKGRLRQMQDETGTTTLTYTPFGELDTETRSISDIGDDPEVFVLDYDYTAAGNIKKITLPDGRTVDYIYDSLGRADKVKTTFSGVTTTLVKTIGYRPFGPMRIWTYGNGLVQSIEYDDAYRPVDLKVGTLYEVDYGFDAGGVNIESIVDVATGPDWDQTFHYDALNRLEDEDGADGFKAYEYDENGNRLYVRDNQQAVLQQLTYETNSNRMASLDQSSVGLDAAGNTLDDATTHTYDYDDRGRLVVAYNSGVAKGQYRYNGFGQLTFKTQKPGNPGEYWRTFLYGQNGELLFESVFLSSGVRRDMAYLWLNGVPIAFIRTRYYSTGGLMDEVLTYVHPDHLGTPRIGTKSDSQTISWRWQSDAFGEGDDETDPDDDGVGVSYRLRFPGQYDEGSMGRFYNYFRDYDASIGRYMESDPIGLDGGLNTYGYALQNPVSFFDTDGLEVRFICRMLSGPAGLTGGQHCFVYVSCPEEGWSNTLSLFGVRQKGDRLFPSKARKSYNSITSINTDDPFDVNNTFNEEVIPDECPIKTCGFEKAVIQRFHQFPTGLVDYDFYNGPNSNSFARSLATGTEFGGRIPPGHPTMINATGIQMDHPDFPNE